MTRGTRKTIRQKTTGPRNGGAPSEPQRPHADPRIIMRDDEALLNGNADEEQLKRRCELALWTALFDQALVQVARHEVRRTDSLREAAQVWHVRGDEWDEIAKACQIRIRVESTIPWRFTLRLPRGVYSDDACSAQFALTTVGPSW